MKWLIQTFKDIRQYPSAVIGLVIISLMVILAIYAVVAIPYSDAIRLWRGGEEIWGENPRTVPPAWTNLFRAQTLPETIVLQVDDEAVTKSKQAISEGMYDVVLEYPFDYPYDGFPQSMSIFFTTQYDERPPHVSLSWLTPDGREIRLGEITARQAETYRVDQDDRLIRRLGGAEPRIGLFADPELETPTPIKGTYTLLVEAITFEEDADVDAKAVIYGQVHGLAGTDHRRRDLTVALLWGTPIALSFGLLAALGTTLVTMVIAAVGVWFGGAVDGLIQRITEINMVLPFLPILIMVGTFLENGRSIWMILIWVIALSIFGAAIKSYRAIFLQVKESPYIEAAQAYGAGNWRLIIFYLVPRIIPVLIPGLVSAIPSYVFLEASLALLGLGDPILPTWGKLIDDARSNGALYNAQYYWVLQPAVLLMVVGLAFAMVGFALDRVFNPRLREI